MEAVEHRADGTMLKSGGVWWPEKHALRRHPSPDGQWHICLYDFHDGRGIQIVCVFVPAGT